MGICAGFFGFVAGCGTLCSFSLRLMYGVWNQTLRFADAVCYRKLGKRCGCNLIAFDLADISN